MKEQTCGNCTSCEEPLFPIFDEDGNQACICSWISDVTLPGSLAVDMGCGGEFWELNVVGGECIE